MTPIHLLELSAVPILKQLYIEEALLRVDSGNWFIINSQVESSIVMGISGKPEKLINLPYLKKKPIPLIKRFSGGGTVVIDQDTCFSTFIFNQNALPITPYPLSIMQWSESFYRPAISHPDFHLRENDYVIGEKKCGGNAQYIQKGRWLHHTSFLWDYQKEKMDYLLLPEKRPNYRNDRCHEDFLYRLKNHFCSVNHFLDSLKNQLHRQFDVKTFNLKDIEEILAHPHRRSTEVVLFDSYSCLNFH